MKKHTTPQENFWAGEFGTYYIERNESPNMKGDKKYRKKSPKL